MSEHITICLRGINTSFKPNDSVEIHSLEGDVEYRINSIVTSYEEDEQETVIHLTTREFLEEMRRVKNAK